MLAPLYCQSSCDLTAAWDWSKIILINLCGSSSFAESQDGKDSSNCGISNSQHEEQILDASFSPTK
ncbi:unnamed protein product [Musa acuminata subsp. burmannicoides]